RFGGALRSVGAIHNSDLRPAESVLKTMALPSGLMSYSSSDVPGSIGSLRPVVVSVRHNSVGESVPARRLYVMLAPSAENTGIEYEPMRPMTCPSDRS